MSLDGTHASEASRVGAGLGDSQLVYWRAEWQVDKFWAGADDVRAGRYVSSTNPPARFGLPVAPYETIKREGNLLLLGGTDVLWLGLRTGLSASTGVKNTLFNNANAAINVGDTTAAAVNTQVDLGASSASTNRSSKGMEATYPLHTTGDGTTACRDITFRSVFSTAFANFAWGEWGVGNHVGTTAPYKGRLLNRKVEALGTKTAAASWTFTVKLSLS